MLSCYLDHFNSWLLMWLTLEGGEVYGANIAELLELLLSQFWIVWLF